MKIFQKTIDMDRGYDIFMETFLIVEKERGLQKRGYPHKVLMFPLK